MSFESAWKHTVESSLHFNTLRLRQNSHHFPEDIFMCIFLNENLSILNKTSLKFVPKVWLNNIPTLVQTMAWCGSGDKPLSEPMMGSLLTRICVTQPHCVNGAFPCGICPHDGTVSCLCHLGKNSWVQFLLCQAYLPIRHYVVTCSAQ